MSVAHTEMRYINKEGKLNTSAEGFRDSGAKRQRGKEAKRQRGKEAKSNTVLHLQKALMIGEL
jgi:hypothetical protein